MIVLGTHILTNFRINNISRKQQQDTIEYDHSNWTYLLYAYLPAFSVGTDSVPSVLQVQSVPRFLIASSATPRVCNPSFHLTAPCFQHRTKFDHIKTKAPIVSTIGFVLHNDNCTKIAHHSKFKRNCPRRDQQQRYLSTLSWPVHTPALVCLSAAQYTLLITLLLLTSVAHAFYVNAVRKDENIGHS